MLTCCKVWKGHWRRIEVAVKKINTSVDLKRDSEEVVDFLLSSFYLFSCAYSCTPFVSHRLCIAPSWQGPADPQDFEQEISFMRTLRHPNVVLFFGSGTLSDGSRFLVTELMVNGSLRTVLSDPGRGFTHTEKCRFALQAARGMAHIHSLQKMHRDLKSGAILSVHRNHDLSFRCIIVPAALTLTGNLLVGQSMEIKVLS